MIDNEIEFKDHNGKLLKGVILDKILVPNENISFAITNYLVRIKESGVIVRVEPQQIKKI